MARPTKKGLDYFPLDVDLEDEVALLEAETGLEGFAILIKLWQKIYKHGYFLKWDKDSALLFARQINSGVNTVNSVVNVCLRRSILSNEIYKNYSVLTSAGIQRRYLKACSESKRKNIEFITEFTLVNSEFTRLISELITLNQEESTQRKGKESKGNKSIEEHAKNVKNFIEKNPPKKFKKPTIEEVKKYIEEKKFNVNPDKWFNHYEANGWKVGKNSMQNWKASVRYWNSSNFSGDTPSNEPKNKSSHLKEGAV